MRLGVDFGTTRTVVAAIDRGNYPIVSFQLPSGDTQLWHPSLIASRDGELRFGLDAEAALEEPGWVLLRSLKRLLGESGLQGTVTLGEREEPLQDLLAGYLRVLRRDLLERSNLDVDPGEPLEAMVAVPANSNSNQRFVTLEAFRRAGFEVAGMLSEPSAAGVEYSHHYAGKASSSRRQYLVVYDLGGGTFDVSVVTMQDGAFEVLATGGIAKLGGDDFDVLLLEQAVGTTSEPPPLTPESVPRLLEACREQKEGLHPSTKKIVVDLSRAPGGSGQVVVDASEFYARCRPLVERTVELVEATLRRCRREHGIGWDSIASIYLVGGSSDLPVVARTLRHRWPRGVRRAAFPFAATAIGLAVALGRGAEVTVLERAGRCFGVWREREEGREIVFDPIFPQGTELPAPGEPTLEISRRYQAAHNIGHYRFLECTTLVDDEPAGDITPWQQIRFPLDRQLRELPDLDGLEVERSAQESGDEIEERYVCDADGVIRVTLANLSAGYERTFRLR